jgi:hypothetical protein
MPLDDGILPLAQQLERGQIVHFSSAPFALPDGADRDFLLTVRLSPFGHKNISFDPATGRLSGFANLEDSAAARLRTLLAAFSRTVASWLATLLPTYPPAWSLDRVSLATEEEATRRLRHKARNDLLHVDSFPSRPTNGARLLRVFANIHPTEERVWVTSDPFARLLERYGVAAGLPDTDTSLLGRLRAGVTGLLRPGLPPRSVYDAFMLRFHDFLKGCDDLQERGPKKRWLFGPGSVWMAMTDACSYAVLRGRGALEHSFFVRSEGLALPDESPAALLAARVEGRHRGRAA